MSDDTSIGINNTLVVQKKLMPCKKPKNRGGSPKGVNEPPILATRKMKIIMVWTLFLRFLFDRIIGRISNIAAPVVPIHDAKTVPMNKIIVFTFGVPAK